VILFLTKILSLHFIHAFYALKAEEPSNLDKLKNFDGFDFSKSS